MQMDKPKETLRVLDDFDVTLSMDSRLDAGRQQTDIDISIQALILRVSFRDILLINSILSRAIELSNRNTTESLPDAEQPIRPPPKPAPGAVSSNRKVSQGKTEHSRRTSASRRRSSSAATGLKAQVIVTKERVSFSTKGISNSRLNMMCCATATRIS